MKTIGIDQNNYLVYEGNSTYGHAIWPTPAILPASIVDESVDDLSPKFNNDLLRLPFLFVDDGYDPTSRVRKGRIFEKYEMQPNKWHVHPHPATPEDDDKHTNRNGVLPKLLATFREFNFQPKLRQLDISNPLIALGSNTQFTIWSIIDIETSVSGETIIFLKARKTIGVLPKVDYSKINAQYHEQIKNKLGSLADDVYKAGPDSIVDRSREAASAIINIYLSECEYIDKHRDLGQLVTPLRDKAKKYITANCVDILAKLHSRTKYSEQKNKGLRPINTHDAELAVQSVGMILNELNWAHL